MLPFAIDLTLDASDPQVFFTAFAALILLGFLGNLIFSRLRFNDTVILIGLGVVVGPVLGMVDGAEVQKISTIVGPLALILILFDGGLALKIHDLLHGVGGALVLAATGFVLTSSAVAAVVWWLVPGADFATGLALGAILGGTSALVVLPSLAQLRASKKTGTVLGLESAITDILVVVGVFTMIGILIARGDPSLAPDTQAIASSVIILFTMSLFLGAVGGFLWVWLLPYVRDRPFGYMMTLGTAFSIYVFVEWLLQDAAGSGGGPLAVLAFGIVLGNAADMGRKMKARLGDGFGPGIKRFQAELSFLVRTFFFIYLGILVDLSLFTDLRVLGVGLLIFVAVLWARYIAVAITVRQLFLRGENWMIWFMMPRGLAAAVMAAIPAERGIAGTGDFVAYAFLILVLTNLTTTLGGFVLKPGTGSGQAKRRGRRTASRGDDFVLAPIAPRPAQRAGL